MIEFDHAAFLYRALRERFLVNRASLPQVCNFVLPPAIAKLSYQLSHFEIRWELEEFFRGPLVALERWYGSGARW
jgi:hypothetical protein